VSIVLTAPVARFILLAALFAAVMAAGRPGPVWPRRTVDALWPALSA
jgi:hypothetical protein